MKGACHCGGVTWKYHGEIDRITACSCTVCRRYGALWAYGSLGREIDVRGETASYIRGDREIAFHFCQGCGCVTYWKALEANDNGAYRIAVNTRLTLEPAQIQQIPIRHFDGLTSFADLPGDHRCVKDMWF